MSAIARRLNDQLPAAERNRGISVVPLSLYLVGPQSRLALWMLGGAVFCVFLIAAANVTSLSLARSVARAREMAVRAALGASAGRIVRQLLTESVLLAAVSGLIGTLLASVGIRLIRAFGPGNLPRLNEVSLDPRVLGLGPRRLSSGGNSGGAGSRDDGVAPRLASLRRGGWQKCRGRSGHPSNPPRARGGGVCARDRPARRRRLARPKLVERDEHRSGIQARAGAHDGALHSDDLARRDGSRGDQRLRLDGSTFTIVSSNRFRRFPVSRAPASSAICSLVTPGNRSSLSNGTPERFPSACCSHETRSARISSEPSERRCSAAGSFRSVMVPMHRGSRSSTMRWLAARGPGAIQWADRFKFGPPDSERAVVHGRGRGRQHAAAGAGARTGPADLRVARAESSSERGPFHTNLVGPPAGDGRGTSSGRASRGEACADLWGGASGRAARKLPRAASLSDLAPDRLLRRGATDGRGRDLRAHPVLRRDADTGNRLAHGHRRTRPATFSG